MPEPREFDCADCGIHVVEIVPLAANDRDLCQECLWLRAIPDEKERDELRRFLQDR